MLALIGVAACSPTFNWRELRPEDTPLEALMPCKPESATRPVPLLGAPIQLHMYSCETGGLTFAIAWAELAEAGQVRAALSQWQTASLAAIQVKPTDSERHENWAVKVAGAAEVQGVKAQGIDHLGQKLHSQMAYFWKDRKIYQAAIYGAKVDSTVSATFFDGLELP
ncbi:hypothetical protein [Hydrogenophaga sp. PAMC20947]|uniref:hypothetical protein n=1 Tax=Hydrogenophaga sp. PAMC20947 TaxID=2565558 RepID=UPI00109DF876|nr:hypothetical protein [Hydrogenophaga sp. PAMC20947]QCB47375.1 hypothetical protein E5678_15910 [Hydrogenophaga sp. PAMC20947]